MRVAVIYRVIQEWRLPVFERLNKIPDIELKVFHGPDFKGTKIINSRKSYNFNSKMMFSIPLRLRTRHHLACTPLSPFLFFEMVLYKPDVILCEGASNLPNNIMLWLYCLLFKKPMVQWGLGEIRKRNMSNIRKLLDWLIRKMEKSSTSIFTYSTTGAAYYRRIGVDPQRIFIGVNTIDTDLRLNEIKRFDSELIYKECHKNTKLAVIFIGALTIEKRVDLLIKAYQYLESNYGDEVSLTIVGDGPEKSALEVLANSFKLKRVIFTGPVWEGVSKYFLGADVLVMPGLGGLVVSDAMIHGLTVITGIGDGCEKDLLINGGGIVDDSLDLPRLIGYLEDLLNNPNKLLNMKKIAYETIIRRYNINNYMRSLVDCLLFANSIRSS